MKRKIISIQEAEKLWPRLNYTTSDFSPIHGPDEKPTKKGWYATCCDKTAVQFAYNADCNWWNRWEYAWIDYWDGYSWILSEYERHYVNQSRYWFGLKEKT